MDEDSAPSEKFADAGRAIRCGCVLEGGGDSANWIIRRRCRFEELKSVIDANDQIGERTPDVTGDHELV
jgi:hypothetical protein